MPSCCSRCCLSSCRRTPQYLVAMERLDCVMVRFDQSARKPATTAAPAPSCRSRQRVRAGSICGLGWAQQDGQFAANVSVVVVEQHVRVFKRTDSFASATCRDGCDPGAEPDRWLVRLVPGQVPDLEEGRAGDGLGVAGLWQRQHCRLQDRLGERRVQAPERRSVAGRDPSDELPRRLGILGRSSGWRWCLDHVPLPMHAMRWTRHRGPRQQAFVTLPSRQRRRAHHVSLFIRTATPSRPLGSASRPDSIDRTTQTDRRVVPYR